MEQTGFLHSEYLLWRATHPPQVRQRQPTSQICLETDQRFLAALLAINFLCSGDRDCDLVIPPRDACCLMLGLVYFIYSLYSSCLIIPCLLLNGKMLASAFWECLHGRGAKSSLSPCSIYLLPRFVSTYSGGWGWGLPLPVYPLPRV